MEEKQHDIIEVCRRRKEEFRLPLPVDGWERLEADLKELEKPAPPVCLVALAGGSSVVGRNYFLRLVAVANAGG